MKINKPTAIAIATNLTALAINNTNLIKHEKTRNQTMIGLNMLNLFLQSYASYQISKDVQNKDVVNDSGTTDNNQ